jgi:hypothetical protein
MTLGFDWLILVKAQGEEANDRPFLLLTPEAIITFPDANYNTLLKNSLLVVLCILGMALKFISTFSVPVRTDAHLAEIK